MSHFTYIAFENNPYIDFPLRNNTKNFNVYQKAYSNLRFGFIGDAGWWRREGNALLVNAKTGLSKATHVGHSVVIYAVSEEIVTNTEVQYLMYANR